MTDTPFFTLIESATEVYECITSLKASGFLNQACWSSTLFILVSHLIQGFLASLVLGLKHLLLRKFVITTFSVHSVNLSKSFSVQLCSCLLGEGSRDPSGGVGAGRPGF